MLIVQTAVESASRCNTVLVGDDTDLPILLCFHTPIDCSHEIFRPEPKSGTHKLPRCWNIEHMRSVLGTHICENIFFAHALLICDTASRVFGIGKGAALKQPRSNEDFNIQAEVFNRRSVTVKEIAKAGEKALVSLYNRSREEDTLDQLRLQNFVKK